MQTGFLTPRNKIVIQLPVLPAEMVSAFVPYQGGLKFQEAAEIARALDEENAASFILSMNASGG
jgi:hypothetical protein